MAHNNQPLGQGGGGFSAVLSARTRNDGRSAEGVRDDGRNETMQQSTPRELETSHTQQYTHPGREGGVGGGVRDVGKEEHGKENDETERSAAQSSVSFSFEKETEEPWPLRFFISRTCLDG